MGSTTTQTSFSQQPCLLYLSRRRHEIESGGVVAVLRDGATVRPTQEAATSGEDGLLARKATFKSMRRRREDGVGVWSERDSAVRLEGKS